MDPRTSIWTAVGTVGVVATAVFVVSLQAGFLWDDRAAVLANADVDTNASPWHQAWQHDFWGQDITLESSHKSFRPITVMSYRWNHFLSAFRPFGFHAANVALHVANSILLCLVGRAMGFASQAAFFGALLFAVHPAHVEAVACIVGRADVLSGVFAQLAVLVYLRGARPASTSWATWAAAVALAFLATLSKEVGISTFVVCAVHDALCWARRAKPTMVAAKDVATDATGFKDVATDATGFKDVAMDAAGFTTYATGPASFVHNRGATGFILAAVHNMVRPPILLRLLSLVTAAVAFMRWRLGLHAGAALYQWTILENQFAVMPPGWSRTLSVLYTHVRYAWLLVWPASLSFDHGYAGHTPVAVTVSWQTVSPFLLYTLIVAGVWHLLRRQHAPSVLCAAWCIASFLPACNVFVFVGTEVAERLLYFPTMGACLLFAHWLPIAIRAVAGGKTSSNASVAAAAEADAAKTPRRGADARAAVPSPPSRRRSRTVRVSTAVFVALAVLGGMRCHVRNYDWLSEQQLFESALRVYPSNLKALNNVGLMLLNGNRTELSRAARVLQRAVDLYPPFASARLNLGLAYRSLGNMDDAEHHLRLALDASSSGGKAHTYLGVMYLDRHLEAKQAGLDPAMASEFQHPTLQKPYLHLAKRHAERAPGLGCRLAVLYFTRGVIASELGQPAAALQEFHDALQFARDEAASSRMTLTVDLTNVYSHIALAHRALGDLPSAVAAFEAAVRLQPSGAAFSNGASALMALQDVERAREWHDRAVELEPNNALILTNAGWAYEVSERFDEALQLYNRAVALLPNHPQVLANAANLRARLAGKQQG